MGVSEGGTFAPLREKWHSAEAKIGRFWPKRPKTGVFGLCAVPLLAPVERESAKPAHPRHQNRVDCERKRTFHRFWCRGCATFQHAVYCMLKSGTRERPKSGGTVSEVSFPPILASRMCHFLRCGSLHRKKWHIRGTKIGWIVSVSELSTDFGAAGVPLFSMRFTACWKVAQGRGQNRAEGRAKRAFRRFWPRGCAG